MTRSLRTFLLTSAALLPCALPAMAGPDGPNVVGGAATIQGAGTNSVLINQTTDRAIINWRHFNIQQGERTQFVQPQSTSIALNRVTGSQDPTQIHGQLDANGRVFVVNPSGILVGPNAVINTGGFLATTSDIANENFMAGRFKFDIQGRPDASIVNQGTITAHSGGFAALVAPAVRNSGTITATLGKIGLAAANTYTLDFYGDNLINVGVGDAIASNVIDVATQQPISALVKNEGKLSANGGRVELTAASARKVVDAVINNTGVIEANAIGKGNGGTIVLSAATGATKSAEAPKQVVKLSGTMSARGKETGQKGGKVVVTGEHIELTGATVNVAGAAGGGTALIGGDWGGGKPLAGLVTHARAKLEGGPVPTATTVTIDGASVIDASATHSGDGGKVIAWADQLMTFNGAILATGGAVSGDGGFAEVSSKQQLKVSGFVDLRAPTGATGTLLLDPLNYYINTTGTAPENDPTGSAIAVAALLKLLETANTTIATQAGTGAGDIHVNNSISWSGNTSLTLSAFNDILFTHGAVISNTGAGNLVLRADNTGKGSGTVFFPAPFIPTLLAECLKCSSAPTPTVDFRGSSGKVSIFYNPSPYYGESGNLSKYQNPTNYDSYVLKNDAVVNQLTAYMLINNVTDLQNVSTNLTGTYALGKSIDASTATSLNNGTGFIPIGNGTTGFTGVFDGQNHVIDNLTITSAAPLVGLFALNAGTIRNVGLTDVNITATGTGTSQFMGALTGSNSGTITNAYATGSVGNAPNAVISSAAGGYGGLVGLNDSAGTISQSYANVAVHATGPDSGFIDAGGLVGQNRGTVTNSYAEGAVTGTSFSISNQFLGGLIGWNLGGKITRSYALGSVTGAGANVTGGGLVGSNAGSITESYATGAVGISGTNATAGGLVGAGDSESVTKSFWDMGTTGQVTSAGGTGLTTAQAQQQSSYVGWDFTKTWFMLNGQTRPFLQSEWSTTITNTHQLQLVAMNLGATYTLANNIDFGPNPTNASGMWGTTGFAPIGTVANGFTGSFNGQGNTISNLTIAPTMNGLNSIGLFAVIGSTGNVSNLTLANASVTANSTLSNQFIGTLAGQNAGTIDNVSVTSGAINGLNLSGVIAGGLVGQNGLFGPNQAMGTITQSDAAVNVTLGNGIFCNGQNCNGGFNSAGGLVGNNPGVIIGSSASGNIVVGSHSWAGGLVGANENFNSGILGASLIDSSSAIGNVSSTGVAVGLGGLVGKNAPLAVITSSHATGDVTSTANVTPDNGDCSNGGCEFVSAGGLVGQNHGLILGTVDIPALTQECGVGQTCATGIVSVGSHGTGGGLVGSNDGTIINAFATGNVIGAAGASNLNEDHGATNLGGLAGHNSGVIAGAHARGNIGSLNVANLNVGGLVADNSGMILFSRATGNVQAGNDSSAGGLVANNSSDDFNCGPNCIVGNGHNNLGLIWESHATGNVTVGDRSLAGGLAASSEGVLVNTSASGNVTGGADSVLGGLVGAIGSEGDNLTGGGMVLSSSASGKVESTGPNSVVGGLVGVNFGTIGVFQPSPLELESVETTNLSSSVQTTNLLAAVVTPIGAESTRPMASGPVIGTSDSFLGGLVGINLGLISSTDATGTVTGTGANNTVGGLVGLNLGTIDGSNATGNSTSGANSMVGQLIGANATFINFTAGDIPVSSFPVGTFTGSEGTGTAAGGPNSQVGGPVGANNPPTVPGSLPSIVNNCDDQGCVVLRTGVLGPLATTPPENPPDTPPENPTESPPPVPIETQQAGPPVTVPPPFQLPPINNIVMAALTQGEVVNVQQPQQTPAPRPQNQRGPNQGGTGDRPVSGVPPPGETRFIQNEVLLQIGSNVSREALDRIARQLGLTILASEEIGILGTTAYRFRITSGRSVADIIRVLEANRIFAQGQSGPNYQYQLTQETEKEADPKDMDLTASIPPQTGPAQYILRKLRLSETHQLAKGSNVLIGVIDSEVDGTHPDLQGAVVRRFNAAGGEDKPHAHGTAMAGAIAAQRRLTGTAPGARVLAVNAFSATATSAESTTFQILKGIDWAVKNGARVLNMSFAGPFDPTLQRALKVARDKGIVLVAAAGNAGPKSAPLFPGADPNVIAVTATDVDDKLFNMANRGRYIAVAAPGVDILVPAPQGSYQTTTGTSVATAIVSGVVALLLERDPTLTPADIKKILTTTARRMGTKERDDGYGSGVIDAYQAVTSLSQARP